MSVLDDVVAADGKEADDYVAGTRGFDVMVNDVPEARVAAGAAGGHSALVRPMADRARGRGLVEVPLGLRVLRMLYSG